MSDTEPLIPSSWVIVCIEELLTPLDGGKLLHHGWSPQCHKEPVQEDGEWGVLKTTAIQAGAFIDEHNKRLPSKLDPRPHLEVHPGDLLLTCAGPRARCGVPCLVRNTRPRLLLSGKMYRFRVPERHLDSRYMEAYLLSSTAQSAIDRMKTGISDSGLNLTHRRFKELLVVLAPHSEQRRIVEAIESYFTRLDDAAATTERVQRNLERFRGSVLKAAVEGRLVPTEAELACAEGRDYEPASIFLARILAERRRRWEKAELAKIEAKGKTPKNDKWKAKYKEPAEPDTSTMPSLPEGWCWATAEALSDETRSITYGVVKLGAETPGGVPTLRSSNVRHLRLELEYIKPISEEILSAYQRTILQGGEVLVTVRGTLGGVVDVPTACIGFNISREVAMIALVETSLAPLVATFIGSSVLQNWIMRRTRGIAYTGINIATLKELPVPVPPVAEQPRIVDAVQHSLSIAVASESVCADNQRRCQSLRQSILKWAFEGKLVDQDPTDEPATELLARIKAERDAAGDKRRKARGHRKPGSTKR